MSIKETSEWGELILLTVSTYPPNRERSPLLTVSRGWVLTFAHGERQLTPHWVDSKLYKDADYLKKCHIWDREHFFYHSRGKRFSMTLNFNINPLD